MTAGDCTKSSTMLYVWESLVEETFRCIGPLGILGITSTLGRGICKVSLVTIEAQWTLWAGTQSQN